MEKHLNIASNSAQAKQKHSYWNPVTEEIKRENAN